MAGSLHYAGLTASPSPADCSSWDLQLSSPLDLGRQCRRPGAQRTSPLPTYLLFQLFMLTLMVDSLSIALGTLEPLDQASKFYSSSPLGSSMYVLCFFPMPRLALLHIDSPSPYAAGLPLCRQPAFLTSSSSYSLYHCHCRCPFPVQA
jgi:hypothetical protein